MTALLREILLPEWILPVCGIEKLLLDQSVVNLVIVISKLSIVALRGSSSGVRLGQASEK